MTARGEPLMTADSIEPGADLAGTGLTRTCLYQLDAKTIEGMTTAERKPLIAWVKEHGLDPERISMQGPLVIWREPNGKDYVSCRVSDHPAVPCRDCGCCIRTEAAWVPWNGEYPDVKGGWRHDEPQADPLTIYRLGVRHGQHQARRPWRQAFEAWLWERR